MDFADAGDGGLIVGVEATFENDRQCFNCIAFACIMCSRLRKNVFVSENRPT